MKKILIIEDSIEINELLIKVLGKEYETTSAFSGTEGLIYFNSQSFDLIILDIMLPGKAGEEVLKEIRERSNIPVIMLTSISGKKTITDFLLSGADDYLTKPFDVNELNARIIVQLRKNIIKNYNKMSKYKNIELYPETFEIGRGESCIQLKKKEFEIFELLLTSQKKIFTKESLYEAVWGEVYCADENTINVHISNLRKKIHKLDPTNNYIETVWGIGVKLG